MIFSARSVHYVIAQKTGQAWAHDHIPVELAEQAMLHTGFMILAGCARMDNSLSSVKLCKCKDIPSKCLEQIWSDRVIFILDQFFVSCYCDIIWIFSATEQVSNWIFSTGVQGPCSVLENGVYRGLEADTEMS